MNGTPIEIIGEAMTLDDYLRQTGRWKTRRKLESALDRVMREYAERQGRYRRRKHLRWTGRVRKRNNRAMRVRQ